MPTNKAIAEVPIGMGGEGNEVPPALFAYEQTVISQYANSPILLQLIANMVDYLDPIIQFDSFYTLIWNIASAEGYGLDVWGRILGFGRVLQVPVGDYLGFEEATDADTFGYGIFYGSGTLTDNFALSDTVYRRVLLAKAFANISDGSIPAINQIMIDLFPGYGNCYVIDNLDMTLTYRFSEVLSSTDAVIAGGSLLPTPAGVAASIVQGP